MPEQSDLAQAVQDVSRHAQSIVRDEIELAKAEVTQKVTKLAKGAAVGAAAGVFVLAGLIYLLHALSWLVWKFLTGGSGSDNFWLGFLVVAVFLFLLAGVAGFLAFRFVKGGAPPTPDMAIEEAKRVQQTISSSTSAPIERSGS